MDFWQEITRALIGSIIGTFVGASVAFFFANRTRTRDERAKEQAALSGLLVDLHLKRSLAIGRPSVVDPATSQVDIRRCGDSVLDIRKLIRETRLQLRPKSQAFDPLADMAGACNVYLHNSRVEPERHQFELAKLQATLDLHAKGLKDIEYRSPGGAAYGRASQRKV